MTYIYDATGVKHAKKIMDISAGIDYKYYIGNMEYNNTQDLEYIHTEEGRVRLADNDFIYDLYLKDHLGNTRVVFNQNSSGALEVEQVDNYYPFGMRFNQTNLISDQTTDYMYNGKELQEDHGLNWYDYGARMYDPALGRWHVQDPLVEKYPGCSPYSYSMNNPILLVDPDGLEVKNGQKEERDRAKKSYDAARENYKTTAGKGNKKDTRKAKRGFNKAKRSYASAEQKYQSVEAAISFLEEVAPDIFNELNNLKGPNNQTIDINVTSLSTNETYIKGGEEYDLRGGTYAIPGSGNINSYIINSVTGTKNSIEVKLKRGAGSLILAHEGGHCVYYSGKVREYYYVVLRKNPNWRDQGGHADGDPNGVAADNMEARYRKAYQAHRRKNKFK